MHTSHFSLESENHTICPSKNPEIYKTALKNLGVLMPEFQGDLKSYVVAVRVLGSALDSDEYARIKQALSMVTAAEVGVIVGGKSVQTMFPSRDLMAAAETYDEDEWIAFMKLSQTHLNALDASLTTFYMSSNNMQ